MLYDGFDKLIALISEAIVLDVNFCLTACQPSWGGDGSLCLRQIPCIYSMTRELFSTCKNLISFIKNASHTQMLVTSEEECAVNLRTRRIEHI